jgi:hypothetical protein
MKALRKLVAVGGAGAVAALTALSGKLANVAAAANPYGIVGGEVSLVSGGNSVVAALLAAVAVGFGLFLAFRFK